MVFLIAQQVPEPQWNTISRINSDAAYEILKTICSSLTQKLRMHCYEVMVVEDHYYLGEIFYLLESVTCSSSGFVRYIFS